MYCKLMPKIKHELISLPNPLYIFKVIASNISRIGVEWYGNTLSVASYELLVMGWKFRSASWSLSVRVQIHELQVQIHKLKFTSYEFKSTNYEFKSTSYEFKSRSLGIISLMKTQANSLKTINTKGFAVTL